MLFRSLRQFAHLKYSLIVVLLFVGVKMLIAHWIHISGTISLGVIVGLLGAGVVASQVLKKDEEDEPESSEGSSNPDGGES